MRKWEIRAVMLGTPIHKTFYKFTTGELTRSAAQNHCFNKGYQLISFREVK